MEKAIVPKQVAQALDLHFSLWKGQTQNAMLLQFMAVTLTDLGGTTAILRNFALKDPATYMHAVLYGYEPRIEDEKDLANVIEIWMAKPYVDDERKDIEQFAGVITKHFQQQ
jgi:hypothetical protein